MKWHLLVWRLLKRNWRQMLKYIIIVVKKSWYILTKEKFCGTSLFYMETIIYMNLCNNKENVFEFKLEMYHLDISKCFSSYNCAKIHWTTLFLQGKIIKCSLCNVLGRVYIQFTLMIRKYERSILSHERNVWMFTVNLLL